MSCGKLIQIFPAQYAANIKLLSTTLHERGKTNDFGTTLYEIKQFFFSSGPSTTLSEIKLNICDFATKLYERRENAISLLQVSHGRTPNKK